MKNSNDSSERARRNIAVVTIFLTWNGRIAVFQRSEHVGTYQGRWAGVSGYMEQLPLCQAWVEISEEVGLPKESVALRGIGVPVIVQDDNVNCNWEVHPFLFGVSDPSAIRLDWEAKAMEWIEPAELSNLQTVPGLKRALETVWPAFGDDDFWNALADIATDTVHGATSLAISGLRALESYVRRDTNPPTRRAAAALAACRPSMGIFPHLAVRFISDKVSAEELISSLNDATSASAGCAAQALAGYSTVLTNSYSSAVKETIIRRHRMPGKLHVIVCESRPENEGVTLARELATEGVRVSVITDAQAGIFASEVDAVLVGCDSVTAEDEIQNKAGTFLLALAARACGVPCFAVTQTAKIAPVGFPHCSEEQDPDRVGHENGIRFRNFIFDTTPISLFEAVYTENGVLTMDMLTSVRNSLAVFGKDQ